MSKQITITCPACSATLVAPVSAVGKTLLCPKCRTGIPVQKQTKRTSASIEEHAGDAHNQKAPSTEGKSATRRQKLSKGERLFLLLTFGVAALLAIALLIDRGTGQYRIARRTEAIERAFKDEDFDLVLTLEPNHVDALIARAQQRLRLPHTNVKEAMHDLANLQKLAPDHSIHHEILPALSVAESVEHAEAGRIAAAIQELENATRLKAEAQQLVLAKETLISAVLKQAESNLRNERYDEALADCDAVLKLGGTLLQFRSIQLNAWDALGNRAATAEDIYNAIQGLETLQNAEPTADLAEKLRSLCFRRSRLAYDAGDLDLAVMHFVRSQSDGPLDAEFRKFGIDLAIATAAAYAADPSEKNRTSAVTVAGLLDNESLANETPIQFRLQLAEAMLTNHDSQDRDSDVEFADRSLSDARFQGINLEPHQKLINLLAQALADRGIHYLEQSNFQQGVNDIWGAIDLNTRQRLPLLQRLKLVGVTIPADLMRDLQAGDPDPLCSLIPSNAEAFSVIRDVESFSDKVDLAAGMMNLPMPQMLDSILLETGIRNGLARNGSPAWVKVPIPIGSPSTATGNLYYVPTTDFAQLIQPLKRAKQKSERPIPAPNLVPVNMVQQSGVSASLKSHGVFAFLDDQAALSQAIIGQNDGHKEFIPLGDWGTDLDGYFVLTQHGIISGLQKFPVPFSTPLLELLLAQIQVYAHRIGWLAVQDRVQFETWLEQFAVGLAIEPDRGIGVHARAWLEPDVILEEFLSENTGGREHSLNLLPDAPFLLATGGPVSAVQSEKIWTLLTGIQPDQGGPELSISHVQFAVLAPTPLVANAKGPKPANELDPLQRFQNRFVLIIQVQDTHASLNDIEARFHEMPGNVRTIERVDLNGVPVLHVRDAIQLGGFDLGTLPLKIAAASNETLVVTCGDDEQLTQALAPSRGAANLSQSKAVVLAVRLLPESSSWVAVLDLKHVIREAASYNNIDSGNRLLKVLADQWDTLPVAFGVSWQQSVLDVDLSVPQEIFPFAGVCYWFLQGSVGH